jgi:hypothetical protein
LSWLDPKVCLPVVLNLVRRVYLSIEIIQSQ